jgi:hypothetical protein
VEESGPVSHAGDPPLEVLQAVQSETTLVRATGLEGGSQLVLAYQDASELWDPPSSGVWATNYSLIAWSTSDDDGASWVRRGFIPAAGEVEAWRGDPWLAAFDNTVLLVGMDDTASIAGEWGDAVGVALVASQDSGLTFGDPVRVAFDGSRDGPKIAFRRNGADALAIWASAAQTIETSLITDVGSATPTAEPVVSIDPGSFGQLPSCPGGSIIQIVLPHAVVASGFSGNYYIAYRRIIQNTLGAFCGGRLEVLRSSDGTNWERILEEPMKVADHFLLTRDPPLAQGHTSPSLAVSSDESGDVVLLAMPEKVYIPFPSPVEYEQRTQLFRLTEADTCSPGLDESCALGPNDGWTTPELSATWIFDIDDVGIDDEVPVWDTIGHFEIAPTLFTGDAIDAFGGPVEDSRLGLFFYIQPWRGWVSPDEDPFLTAVFGIMSADAGTTWGLGHSLTVPIPGIPSVLDIDGGVVFEPCPTETSGYYGHYLGGAFTSTDVEELRAVASWAESREGCDQRAHLPDTFHQHVFSATMETFLDP